MPDRATHCPGCGIPITDCRVLFRERGEGETPEDFMREYARSSPYGHEQACRVVERLEAQFLESRSFQVSEVARMFGIPPHMLMDTVLASRAWAVWDRKRRARRKR